MVFIFIERYNIVSIQFCCQFVHHTCWTGWHTAPSDLIVTIKSPEHWNLFESKVSVIFHGR